MANVGRLFPTVGKDTTLTKASEQYSSPISGAISNLAQTASGVGQQFVKQYEQAQYVDGMTDAQLRISKAVTAYHEDRRQNPVLITDGKNGETIIELKEKDWNEFSKQLQLDYISNIPNRRVRDEISNTWASQQEGIRANIVEEAITEDVNRMANNSASNVQKLASLGDFSQAREAVVQGYATGLHSEAQVEDLNEYINLQEVVKGADFEPVPGSMNMESFANAALEIEASNLPEADKQKAKNYFAEKANQWEIQEEERIKLEEQGFFDDSLNLIFTGQIYSEGQLHGLLTEGTTESFRAKKEPQLMSIWRAWRNEQDDNGSLPDQDRTSIGLLDGMVLENKPREAVISMGYSLVSEGTLTTTKFLDWKNKLGDKNEMYADLALDMFEDWKKEQKDIPQSDLNKLNSEVMRLYQTAAEGRITTGEAISVDEMTKLLSNYSQKVQTKNLGKVTGLFTEAEGAKTFSVEEATSAWLLSGGALGVVSPENLNKFFSTDMTVADFREHISQKEYGVSFADLDDRQESYVKATSDVAVLGKATQRAFVTEYGLPGANLGVDRFGHPIVEVPTEAGKEYYRLQYDPATNEEQWYKWDLTADGQTTTWVPDQEHIRIAGAKDADLLTQVFATVGQVMPDDAPDTVGDILEGFAAKSENYAIMGADYSSWRKRLLDAEKSRSLEGLPSDFAKYLFHNYPGASGWKGASRFHISRYPTPPSTPKTEEEKLKEAMDALGGGL